MALNLSTLTSSATSGDVLAEALTTADFLENVPVLRNLARGSQKGGDAKQDVALNQPKALPYDGKGYLYLSGIAGNYASVPNAANLNGLADFVMEAKDVYMSDWADAGLETFISKYTGGNEAFSFRRYGGNINIYAVYGGVGYQSFFIHGLTGAATANIRVTRVGTIVTAELDTGSGYAAIGNAQGVPTDAIDTGTAPIEIGGLLNGSTQMLLGKISRALIWNNATASGTPVLDVDFTATNIRHGDTKFKCATGQIVTINTAGNDPSTIIKKPVLRFANQSNDTTAIGLKGLFNQTITDGYLFAAFSVLGDGGENFGRILGLNAAGGIDSGAGGVAFRRNGVSTDLMLRYNQNNLTTHSDFLDDERGDYLLDVKVLTGSQKSKVNNADLVTGSHTGQLNAEEFSISSFTDIRYNNAAIDLEFLALFSADSVPDEATASKIRDYINKRNQIYLRHQTDGFYFFNPQKLAAGDVTSWNGNITGSDLGDTDVATNVTIVQGSQTSQPNADGYSLTFEDNTQHLEWASAYTPNFPAGQTKAWQIVGTSLGTFAYLTQGSVTELNLLGNLGNATYRKAGDLYGIILLPESASSADIEAAKRLLIDRGASESFTGSNLYSAWYQRGDIVEFKAVPMQEVTNIGYSFASKTALVSFPAMSFPALTYAVNAWQGNTSMSDFGAIQAPLCTNFTSAWNGCSALTSFPAGAKLGTSANNVNFQDAWRSSGITSFSTPLPTATNLRSSFEDAVSLVSFNSQLPLATNALFAWDNCSSLTSFDVSLPSLTAMYRAWAGCSSLTDFSADVFSNWNPQSISSGVFDFTWQGCTALTAQSVGNILQSIDASNQHGTDDGTSTGNPLGDSGIDIDYNVATGSLSAATNTAVDSLKAKGWSIIVNNVTL
jgi:hypothetical protein